MRDKIVLVCDRYCGCYSGAAWTAWWDEAPDDIDADDVTCANFWYGKNHPCGKGLTCQDALHNLLET